MHLTDNYKDMTAHALVHSARQGLHTVPQNMADDYDELMQAIADGKDARDRWISPEVERNAEKIARRLQMISNYGGTDHLIRDHIAPAVDECLDTFHTNLAASEPWGQQVAVSLAMLELPDDKRAAIVQVHTTCAAYDSLRRVWALLRGGTNPQSSTNTDVDPRGANSILGEVRNIHELIPAWEWAGTPGNDPWPWHGSNTHARLCWLVDRGAEFWAPTRSEHDALWRQLRQASLEARRTTQVRRPAGATGTHAA